MHFIHLKKKIISLFVIYISIESIKMRHNEYKKRKKKVFIMGLSKKKEQGYLKKVKENGLYLRRIETDQTPEICLEAVKENPDALEYVNNHQRKVLNQK